MSTIEGSVRVTLRPDEIVKPDAAITLESERTLDAEVARRAIGAPGMDGGVTVADRGRTAAWRPASPMAAGRHVLVVDELLDTGGRRLTAGGQVPFFVTDTRAAIPDGVAVESLVRLARTPAGTARLPIDERPEGPYVDFLKGVDRSSGRPVAITADQDGNPVDGDAFHADLLRSRAKDLGKLDEALQHALRQASGDPLPVAVWLTLDDDVLVEERPERIDDADAVPRHITEQRQSITRRAEDFTGVVREVGGRDVRPDAGAPVVYAVLGPDAIRRLAESADVAGIFLHETEGIEDLQDSIAIANSDTVHTLGVTGAGTKVAVWERGPDSVADLSIAARFDTSSSAATSQHSRHVHGIVKNTESGKPQGHAPGCSLHSANGMGLDALRWAVQDRSCTVVNQSFHRSHEPGASGLSFDDVYKDWLALRWPYPTIIQAAGNFWQGDPDNIQPPSDEYVNHKGFNSLAVGNHNDSAGAMSPSSVFRNPASPHGDRELPELCANGTGVTTVALQMSGTSMASPAVVGITALLQSTDATLRHWPEGCRAVLLAGATRNVSGSTWWQDVVASKDASDGSGSVDALESHRIAASRRFPTSAPSQRGWNIGSLTSASFDGTGTSTLAYRLRVPNTYFGPRTVKVALAWTSRISSVFGMPISSNLAVDLDLRVLDAGGAVVAYSGSWDNSYEIAEFTGKPGAVYTIRIRRWSGTELTYYGLAWTVSGGLVLRAMPLELAGPASQ